MKPINCSYIYNMGQIVERLENVKVGDRFKDALPHCLIAYDALRNFCSQDVHSLNIAKEKAYSLINALDELAGSFDGRQEELLDQADVDRIRAARTDFEAVLKPEWDRQAVFAVSLKRGYDSWVLVWDGLRLFAPGLAQKVPSATSDFSAATRCIAFELPTAAAFHLCRGLEAVVRRFFEEKVGTLPQEASERTLGSLLVRLEKSSAMDSKLSASLRDLKTLHRNPAMHPERSLESIDEAIALLNAMDAPITHMLRAIPDIVE